jgi:hypothetical protein
VFRIGGREYWRNVVRPALLVNVWPASTAILLATFAPPHSWITFFSEAAATSIVAAVSCWVFGMLPGEKRQTAGYIRQVRSRLLPGAS